MKMILAVCTAAIMAALSFNVHAQSTNNTPPTPPPVPASPEAFYAEAFGWFTSFNPSNTWTGDTFELAVGGDYENGVQWANFIEPQYDVNGGNFVIGDEMRNAGIGGVVESDEAEIGYAIESMFDLRVEAKLLGGYSLEYRAGMIEPKLDIRKKLTTQTFLGLYISEPIYVGKNFGSSSQWIPNFGAETGFTGGGISASGQTVALHTRMAHGFYAFKKFISPQSY